MILIDTSVLSRVFRRATPGPSELRFRETMTALMNGEAALGLPGIVLQEVLSGIRRDKQFEDLERRLVSGFAIVPATAEDHVGAARLKNKCLAKGLNASGVDCLIAAITIAGRHELLTLDDDFHAIAKLSTLKLTAI